MNRTKHRASLPLILATLAAATAAQVQAAAIYLYTATTGPLSSSVTYNSGPGFSGSYGSPGFYPDTTGGGSVTPNNLGLGLNAAAVSASGTSGTLASASIDLTTGVIREFDAACVGCLAHSVAALTDSVTFSITDSASSATVGFGFHVDGAATGAFTDTTTVNFGPAGAGFQYQGTSGPPSFGLSGNSATTAFSSFSITNESTTGFDVYATFTVTDGMTVPLFLQLQLDDNGGTADFTHTAALSLVLPSDVTFKDDTGVLLSQAATSTPEPGTWTLLAMGLGCLAWAHHRRLAK